MKRIALISTVLLMAQGGPNNGGSVIAYWGAGGRPNKGDAQVCIINAWLRGNYPDSIFLPENGWKNDPPGYRCPDEPVNPR